MKSWAWSKQLLELIKGDCILNGKKKKSPLQYSLGYLLLTSVQLLTFLTPALEKHNSSTVRLGVKCFLVISVSLQRSRWRGQVVAYVLVKV